MTDHLTRFPVSVDIPIRWGDMDAFQHVNNTVYFRYFETARIAYLEQLDVAGFMGIKSVGPIVAAINCRFRFPLTYPDRALTGVRVIQMGDDRFVMEHRLVSQRHGIVAAEGTATVVTYDFGAAHKAAIPDEVRQRILALEAAAGNNVLPLTRA